MTRQKVKVPEILYHATSSEFDVGEIQALSHFGTLKAATSRVVVVLRNKHGLNAPSPFVVHPVHLDIMNPLRIRDGEFLHSPLKLADMLFYTLKVITDAERGYILDGAAQSGDVAKERIVGVLREHGYDGLVYRNKFEDPGQDSWVAFDASQVTSAGPAIEMDAASAYEAIVSDNLDALMGAPAPKV